MSALHTGHLGQVALEGGADRGREAAALRKKRANALHRVAYRHAAAALDALAVVAHQRRRAAVGVCPRLGALEGHAGNPQILGQPLQLAIAVAGAGRAGAVVLGKQQFHNLPPRPPHAGRVGRHNHARGHRGGAGWHQRPGAMDLDQADAAGAGRAEVPEMAEGRDADAGPGAGGENGLSRLRLDPLVVDLDGEHGTPQA